MSHLTFGKQKKRFDFERLRAVVVWIFQIAIVCLIAFVCVWYFGQKVSTVGDSMKPVLKNGDVTLTNRIVYSASSPKRGDIIAFKPNGNENSHYYIKRIVGLPGETIEFKEGNIFINGKQIKETYQTTEIKDVGIVDEPINLGNDEFFVLGDDRQNSEDSRSADIGNIKRTEIEGKVWFILLPKDNFGFVK